MTDVVVAPYPELLSVQFCTDAENFMLLSPSEQFLLFSQLSSCTIINVWCADEFLPCDGMRCTVLAFVRCTVLIRLALPTPVPVVELVIR